MLDHINPEDLPVRAPESRGDDTPQELARRLLTMGNRKDQARTLEMSVRAGSLFPEQARAIAQAAGLGGW